MSLKSYLRSLSWWIKLRELQREGIGNVYERIKVQNLILKTPPILTQEKGDIEIRVLTWRRDCINLIWALKSFYHFSPTKFPLYIHDGGLLNHQKDLLLQHFPKSILINKNDASRDVESFLKQRNLDRSIEYRKSNVATIKVWDYFILSQAKVIIHIDSDILFFKYPEELLNPDASKLNLFNRDCAEAYSLTCNEIKQNFTFNVPPLINSGLFRVAKESMDWNLIEKLLHNQKMFDNKWVTEQTLHAINSSLYGVRLLSNQYQVSTEKSDLSNLVCKHYPGFFRPLFYQEGINHLLKLNLFIFK